MSWRLEDSTAAMRALLALGLALGSPPGGADDASDLPERVASGALFGLERQQASFTLCSEYQKSIRRYMVSKNVTQQGP